jgi:hypothetical protein
MSQNARMMAGQIPQYYLILAGLDSVGHKGPAVGREDGKEQ